VLIGGTFTTVGGVTRNYLARLNADGSLDTGFNSDVGSNADVNKTPISLAVQADGKVLIGGTFSGVGGAVRYRIARLNADGSLDHGFNPNSNKVVVGIVTCLAVQADGKVLIGGAFTTMGGAVRNRIARLNADGSLDTGFNPNTNYDVFSLAVQADGKVLIGGYFTTVGGVARNHIARLNADGSLDTVFNPNANEWVTSIAVQADGKVLIGGAFTTMGGVERNNVARLTNDPATQSLAIPDATRVRWSRTGSTPAVRDVVFEQSVDDGATWTLLGTGARIGITADWELTGLSLAVGSKVRATGRAEGGDGSSGLIRQVHPITLATVDTTLTATVISSTPGAHAMALGGSISADGGEIIEGGFVYAVTATNSDPQIGNPGVIKLPVTSTTGSISGVATGLSAATSYSYRIYATNSAGTVYSAVDTFTTLSTVTTLTATSITTTGATVGGAVVSLFGGRAVERGVVYSDVAANPDPQLEGLGVIKLPRSGSIGSFNVAASGLSPGTTYAYRAYLTISTGTDYSPVGYFTTDTPVTFTSGIGTVSNRVIRGGGSQLFLFDLDQSSAAAFSTTGASPAMQWELRVAQNGPFASGATGGFTVSDIHFWRAQNGLITSGTGNVDFSSGLPIGGYTLRITNAGASTETLSLNLDASTPASPRPDVSVGLDPTFNPTAPQQSVLAISRKAATKNIFFWIGNDGPVPDAMQINGPGSDSRFRVTYVMHDLNVTAAVIAGTLSTRGDIVTSRLFPHGTRRTELSLKISPNRKNTDILRKVVVNQRATWVYGRETFGPKQLTVRARTDPSLSDTATFQLDTVP